VLRVIAVKNKKTISLDFDGVLHEYVEWDGPKPKNPPTKGALEFVKDVQSAGYEIIIHSCRARTKAGRGGITKWLEENNFPKIKVQYEKPQAVLYIDDNAYRFTGKFDKTLEFIKNNA